MGDRMKIALLDVHNDNYKKIWDVSGPVKEAYCKRHGYDNIHYQSPPYLFPEGRQDNWGRVHGILWHLREYDWIFYLDTDILIMNHDIKIEDYIDDNYNLIAGPLPHEGHIMTSGMFVKNCQWSVEFFLDMYSQHNFIRDEYHTPEGKNNATGNPSKGGLYFEQSSFHYLYDNYEKYFEKIKLTPRSWFNSETRSYKEGDFLIHFPGQIHKTRLMKTMLEHGHEAVLTSARAVDLLDQIRIQKEGYKNNVRMLSKFVKRKS
jgi:hypothetical protein